MAERMDLERDLYEIHRLTHHEIPFLASQPIPSFETWQETGSADAGYLADLSLLAIEDGPLLGAVEVFDNGDDVIFIGMTAVHPDARRRGIARLLKVELERRARAAGIRRIETYNDGTNERIRGLNESLGYVYNPPYVALRGPLPPPRETGPTRPDRRSGRAGPSSGRSPRARPWTRGRAGRRGSAGRSCPRTARARPARAIGSSTP